MSRYTWTPSGQDEGNIVGSRFSEQVTSRLGLAGFSASAQRDIALLELLAMTPEVLNVKSFGATGDGATDDSGAIAACYAAVPDGGTMFIPEGRFRFASKLSFTRSINIVGIGPGSCLMPDVGALTDAIVFNDAASGNVYRIKVTDFAVLNDMANCCKNAVVLNRVHISEIDLHVKAAAAEYGTLLNGCLINRIRIVTSVNFAYPYPAAMPAHSVKAVRDVPNAIAFNANELDLVIEGGGNGIRIEDQNGEGNNRVSGTIEGLSTATQSLYAGNCKGLNLADLHVEANSGPVQLVDCADSRVGPAVFVGNAATEDGNRITLTGCKGVVLDGLTCGTVSIDATSERCEVGQVEYNNSGTGAFTDLSPSTVYRGILRNAGSTVLGVAGAAASDETNRFVGGIFERWPNGVSATGTPPDGWSFFGGAAFTVIWTKTGDGLADTRRYLHRYAAKVERSDNPVQPSIIPAWDDVKGQWITVWADVYVPTGQPDVTLKRYFNGGADVASMPTESRKDQWVRLKGTFFMTASFTSVEFLFASAALGHFYIGGAGWRLGFTAPHRMQAPRNVAEYLVAGGAKWSSGAGTPEGVVTGSVGDLFTRNDGGASTTLYIKESGANTNTGWVAK
jgi:hypothetical protein